MPKKKTIKKSDKRKILVVEDDRTLNKVLSNVLEEKKFEVFKAFDGAEGLKKALKHKPDLICLDIMMPGMDGLEMLRELRKDEWGKNVFVYILTNADPSEELINEASRTPYVSAYLMKSEVGVQEIVEKVTEKLDKKTVKEVGKK